MSSSTPTAGAARGSLYRPYHRSNSTGSSSSSIENLPPRTLSRVTKEVRDLIKNPPEGVRLVVDNETGLPSSLGEIVVSTTSSRLKTRFRAIHSEATPFPTSIVVLLAPSGDSAISRRTPISWENLNDKFKFPTWSDGVSLVLMVLLLLKTFSIDILYRINPATAWVSPAI